MGLWRHLVVLGAAVAITVVVLGFWIVFGHAVGNYMSRENAEPQQAAQPAQNPGEVTVKIINVPTAPVANPQCNENHPCPDKPHG